MTSPDATAHDPAPETGPDRGPEPGSEPALIDLGSVSMPGSDAESGRGLAIALATLDELVHETERGNVWRLRRLRRD